MMKKKERDLDLLTRIGAKIKAAREEAKMSRDDLGQQVGRSYATIMAWENTRASKQEANLDLSDLSRLACVLADSPSFRPVIRALKLLRSDIAE